MAAVQAAIGIGRTIVEDERSLVPSRPTLPLIKVIGTSLKILGLIGGRRARAATNLLAHGLASNFLEEVEL